MMRDWAGRESSSDEDDELGSAGPGDGDLAVSGCASGDFAGDDEMGRDESLRRVACSAGRIGIALAGLGDEPLPSLSIDVLADVFRDAFGRADRFSVAPEPPPPSSLRGMGESLRDRAEAVRWWPGRGVSAVGVGDGPEDPLAAAVALRTWARTWEAWRSVR